MADRKVTVVLKASINEYLRDVAVARKETAGLRREAEQFGRKRYSATLAVDDRASNAVTRAEKSISRSMIRAEAQVGLSTRKMRGDIMALGRLKVPAIAVGGLAATPAVAGTAADMRRLLGVAGLVPAAMLGAGAAIATVAAGARGFGDAVQDGGEALDKLAPSARKAAGELRSQAAAWRAVQVVAQNRLFAGMADRFDDLGQKYLPVAATAAGGLAHELNQAADAFADFALEADTVRDSQHGLELTRQAATRLAPVVRNLSTIYRDVSAVGAEEFPRLAIGIDLVTDRWRRLVAESRANGRMAEWIDEGIDQAAEFGRILGNTAGILGAVGDAADTAGVDVGGTLDRLTAKAERFLKSAPGQDGMVAFFRELDAAGDALVPGLEAVGGAVAGVLEHASDNHVLTEAARALSGLAEGAAPVVETLGELTSTVLPPLLRLVGDLAPALGPAAGAFFALKAGSSGLGKIVIPAVAGLGGALSGSAAAGGAMAGAASTLISRIPLMGAVIAAAVGTVSALEISAEDAGRVIANGGAAADAMRRSYEENNNTLRTWLTLIPIAGTYLADLVDDQDDVAAATARFETQQRNLTGATNLADQQLKLYNDSVRQFGMDSPQAAYAAEQYRLAVGDLERAQADAGLATDGHTLALTRQRDQFLGAVSTGLAWAGAVDRATQSVRDNGVTVDVNTEAGRRNQTALLDMARAAVADIDAKREHGASTKEITDLTNGHRQQLYDTAIQMGMSKDAAGRYVDQLNLTPADQTTRFHTPGLSEAIAGTKELRDILNGLQGRAESNLNGAIDGARRAVDRAAGGRANGGPIHGPGTATSDSILMRLSNGEYVQRASVVREQGMDRMALLNAGMADIVPRRAGGGEVSRDITIDFRRLAAETRKQKDTLYPPMPAGGWGGGVEQWRPLVLRALAMMGQPASYADLTLRRMNQESGGNPTIVNNWDINAKRGTPSGGLMQTILPTYLANADPRWNKGMFDPLSNILASMRYALRRYGSLPAAYNRKGGYDQGGIAEGVGHMAKYTLKPERVLSPRQTEAFERLVDGVLSKPLPASTAAIAAARSGDSGPRTVINHEWHNTVAETVDADVIAQRVEFFASAASFH